MNIRTVIHVEADRNSEGVTFLCGRWTSYPFVATHDNADCKHCLRVAGETGGTP